ncbi:superoxide dismutase [Xylariales sp. AK1849]|nr:superoxide dismutase [Xylariales sp. AK1849]
MRVSNFIQVSAILVGDVFANLLTGQLGNATVVTDNPIGKEAVGTLPEKAFWTSGSLKGNVKGSLTVKSSLNGIGVDYSVKFSNLPAEGGPFLFHIHAETVPKDGNCTSTGAHLDPFLRGEDPVCDSTFPQTCQVGDLAGKYGKITSDPYEATFHDEFGSLNIGSNASVDDRSFVVHFANKTRITCANFVVVSATNSTPTHAPSGTGSSPTSTSTGVVVTAAATALNAGAMIQNLAAVPLAALFFML